MDVYNLSILFAAQAAPTQQNTTGELLRMVGTFVIFGAIFYFVLIRPQQKRAKQQAEMLKALKRGDKIVTSGGVVGIISSLKDKTLTIKSDDAKLEITRGAVAEVLERSGDSSDS
ncbi:MAG TPA: preprotein translocase subunit YajC [Verrucomicrobiae bacterium]|nr:preprotein translocase subunit YajC [Verrucomicrobiae bacterium]